MGRGALVDFGIRGDGVHRGRESAWATVATGAGGRRVLARSLAFRALAMRLSWALPLAGGGARSLLGVLVLHLALPAIAAFVITGLASAFRTGQGGWASVGW